jgi:CO/xanthine dehydrogenase Mo-binding subunit
MAAKMATDPLAFRLKNLSDQRMIGVLKAAAEKFGWRASSAPSGRGLGLACATDAGAYVATMAEVEVDQESGRVRVKRIVCAQDMGLAINPEGAKIQMEGSLMMGLGYTLTEEVRFDGGRILDRNFDTYEIPRFSWLPKIETVLVENSGTPPAGGGEPPIVCMGGVIANAIFDATGARLFELPMTPERIKNALVDTRAKKAQGIGP